MTTPSKRGPKAKPKAMPREPLTTDLPRQLALKGRVADVYKMLAERIIAEGFASKADARMVSLAASSWVACERLQAAFDALDSMLSEGSTGQLIVNPLTKELRAERQHLAGLLADLLLTPRSRSAVRLSESQARQAAASSAPDLEEMLDSD